MALIELKPLTKDSIVKLGLSPHDLWMVKIEGEVLGPFEVHDLKKYAQENESLFDEALASRVENNDFKPFWSFAIFERQGPVVEKNKYADGGPYWVMEHGQKCGPFSYQEIDKKIKENILSVTEHISLNDGKSWQKILEVEKFKEHSHSSEELPPPPVESSFQKAKHILSSKIHGKSTTPEDVAIMAFLGQKKENTSSIKLDDLTLQNLNEPEVSKSLKWIIPAAVAVVITVTVSGHYLFSPEMAPESLAQNEVEASSPTPPLPKKKITKKVAPEVTPRMPASIPVVTPLPRVEPEPAPRHRTYTETHLKDLPDDRDSEYKDPRDSYKDPRDTYAAEAYDDEREVKPKEHSLVRGTPVSEESLDAAMDNAVEMNRPVIEEASDF